MSAYEVIHYIIDKNLYIYYDEITNKLLFNEKLLTNKYSAKMPKIKIEIENNNKFIQLVDFNYD